MNDVIASSIAAQRFNTVLIGTFALLALVLAAVGLYGIVSHSVTMAALRGAQPVETGEDRNMWDGEFGRRVEDKLRQLYDQTWQLLEENRHEVLAVAHALETVKTITGDDVAAVIEGTQGPLVDGRRYRDPAFEEELEEYHRACLAAHQAHGDVARLIPVPVPPPPPGALSAAAVAIAGVDAGSRSPITAPEPGPDAN